MNAQRHLLLLVTLTAAVTPASGQQVVPAAAPAKIGAQSAATVSDFSGIWRHGNLPWFIPPASGPGPVTNLSREKATGVSDYSSLVGDYKNPPPKGKYDALFEYSKSLMKRDPVKIERELRQFVLDALIDKLLENQIPVAAASLDGIHGHILAQCADRNPRHWIGLAKKNASHLVRQLDLLPPGGLWGKRSHPEPITGPPHYDNSVDYIHKHAHKGAVLYVPEQTITAEASVLGLPGYSETMAR